MVAAQVHRGPDAEGLYVSPSGSCVLGHRRLSILDLKPTGAQPMTSPDGRFVLAYNGECYNFAELRGELEGQGETFRSTGDTEVILRWLSLKGTACLPRLNAMFALALWDEREKRLLLARDRFGQKPLYYARVDGLIVFASEVRAILASGLVPRRADPQGVISYLAYGAVQGPHTIVEGVRLLPRASFLELTAEGGERSAVYWSAAQETSPCSPAKLRESFAAAVKRHLVSDVPIGCFLSGGVDSSAVALSAAAGALPGSVKTLCVTFPDEPVFSEAPYARQVARQAGAEHREVPLSGHDLLGLAPKALAALDQPTADGVNTYVVSFAARQAGLTVALSGLGGDELFGGYPSFGDVPRLMRLQTRGRLALRPVLRALARWKPFDPRVAKTLEALEAPPGVVGAYLSRRRLFTSFQLNRLAPEIAPAGWLAGQSDGRLAELEALARGRSVPDAVGQLEMSVYMGETLLRDSDVMGMAHGLEIRLPFLDAEFSALALNLESGARQAKPFPKWRFVEALKDVLPPEAYSRRKMGFDLPFERWLCGPLAAEVDAGLASLAEAVPALRQDAVGQWWRAFRRDPARVGWARPWALFVLANYLTRHRLRL
jgi:asparagine synthase (glutamine-hydrolysing)